MENVKINYSEIVNYISEEIRSLVDYLSVATEGYEKQVYEEIQGCVFFVEDERDFIKRQDITMNGVYIVVKFGSASTSFGSSVCPISLSVLSTGNKLKPVQNFLGIFCSRYNLKYIESYTHIDPEDESSEKQFIVINSSMSQVWNTPNVLNSFSEADNSFRVLFSISGLMVIGEDSIKLGTMTYLYTEDGVTKSVDIPILSYFEGFQGSLNPQPFGNTAGLAVSETNFFTVSFTISTYLLDNRFVRDCLEARGYRLCDYSNGGERIKGNKFFNDIFEIKIIFNTGNADLKYTNSPQIGEESDTSDPVMNNNKFYKYKLSNYQINQKIGEIPTFTVSFSY